MEILALLFVIFGCIGIYKCFASPSAIGKRGEKKVAKILSQLPVSEYSVINDITLEDNCGSVQIDHVIISLYGIFVIETKNYSGWIMGGEKSDQWVKNVYGYKYYFYNPIKQNQAHILALSHALRIPVDYFISIITFPKEADIKVQTAEHVVYFNDIIPTIFSYSSSKFSVSKVDKITNGLLLLQLNSKERKKEHIKYVKDKELFSKAAIQQGICPRCGGMLKIRKGKYGPFIGCSKYPRCKYTHPL